MGTLQHSQHSWWRTALSKHALSADMGVAEWEVTLSNVTEKTGDQMMIGFVDSSDVDKVSMTTYLGGSSSRPGECAFFISSNGFYECQAGSVPKFDVKGPGKLKNGDRILMRFDWTKKTCSAHFNGELIADLSQALPRSIHIGVIPYAAMNIETTKYKATAKM